METEQHPDLVTDAVLVREFIGTNDGVPCPMCTRMVTDVADAACPHCAAPLALSLGSADLHRAPWIMLVLGLATTLGFAALCVVICILVTRGNVTVAKVFGFFVLNFVMTVLTTVGLTLAIRRRGGFQRRPRRTQRWVAALGLAVPPAWIVVCLVYLID